MILFSRTSSVLDHPVDLENPAGLAGNELASAEDPAMHVIIIKQI